MSADHDDSPIKTPKQLITAVILAFVVPILIIALLVKYVVSEKRLGAGVDTKTEQSVTSRIAPVAGLTSPAGYSLKDPNAPKVLRGGEEVYKAQCAGCHASGAAGAPKAGDVAAWAPRIKTGFDALWGSALKGKGAMAAQGGGEYDDLEIANAVVFMANGAGAKFDAPKQGAAPATAAAPAAAAPVAAASAPGSLPAKVYFDSGKSALTADAKKVIEAAVKTLNADAKAAVELTGYTDKKGNLAANMELSKERAKGVRAALEAAGIAKDRIVMKPPLSTVAEGDDKEARRVEINLASAAVAAPASAPVAAAAGAAGAAVVAAATPAADKGKALYEKACVACHAAGVAGAPKFGDKLVWGKLAKEGVGHLAETVIKGKGAMPAKGGAADATDADIKAAVQYMINAGK